MKVLVRKDAKMAYINRWVISYRQPYSNSFAEMLGKIEGQWIDIETKYLFRDAFNTVPIPEVSEKGLRLSIHDITEIEDDDRPYMMRCNWCGKSSPRGNHCRHCGKSGYLEYFS